MATGTAGSAEYVDMNNLNLPYLGAGQVVGITATSIGLDYGGGTANLLEGTFNFDSTGLLTGGTFTSFKEYYAGSLGFEVSGFSIPATMLNTWSTTFDVAAVSNAVFGGDDQISGSVAADVLVGFGGNDTLVGGDSGDSIDGSVGNDSILGGAGADFIRGLEDNDTIDGGADGDDVNGNLGDDRVFGGIGADTLFGGQGSDTLAGEDGNDWLSGDLGNDAMTGGAGADRFLFRAGSGVDTVTDFSAVAGDRVQLAVGTTYLLTSGSTGMVVDLGGGSQLVLTGVSQAQLGDWLVFG